MLWGWTYALARCELQPNPGIKRMAGRHRLCPLTLGDMKNQATQLGDCRCHHQGATGKPMSERQGVRSEF
jgi:hypothetical protein